MNKEDSNDEIESDYQGEEDLDGIETAKDHAVDNYRLGGRKPLITILVLMGGPVMLQVCGALYGIISTMWVSKAVGNIGVTAISAYSTFDNIGRAFGFFLSVSASTKVSQLFGMGKHEEANQVVTDLLRMCVVCGALVPAILLPIVNICCRWFGCDDEVVGLGFKYLCPILSCSVLTCIYVLDNGLLQGEGRTLLVGIISVCTLCASMFIFETLFLFAFKTGIVGAGVATVLGDTLPAIGLTVCYFLGKFSVKPHLSGFIKKFSPHTLPAMKVGLSQLVANLSMSVPGIVMRKLIGASCTEEQFNPAMAGYNMVFRYAMITNCVVIAVSMGYIPAASYAYASKRYKRFLRLTFHALWISQVWSLITNIPTWVCPREICKIFGSDPDYLSYAGPMVNKGNMLQFISYFRIITQGCLQALQLGGQAMIITFCTQLLAIIVFAFVLYYTNKHDPVRLCWCYPISYALGLVMGSLMLIKPLRNVYRLYKEHELEKIEKKELSDINKCSQSNMANSDDTNSLALIQTNEDGKAQDSNVRNRNASSLEDEYTASESTSINRLRTKNDEYESDKESKKVDEF